VRAEEHRAQRGQFLADLGQFESDRRSAGQLGPNTAARGTDDSGPLERRAHDEYRLADDRGVGGGAGGTTEMDAQVTVPVIVHAIEEAVRRIGTQPYDQRDGRDESDQTITAQTRAQDEGAF
jgi:hypothetical protein